MNRKILMGFMVFILSISLAACQPGKEKNVIEYGKKVKMHVTMSVTGEVIQDTHDGEPVEFVFGVDPILVGLGKGVIGLKAGDQKGIMVLPDEGFGMPDPQFVVEVPRERLPEGDLKVGAFVTSTGPDGRKMQGVLQEVSDETVKVDFNHPLAGKVLDFEVEILDVSDSGTTTE